MQVYIPTKGRGIEKQFTYNKISEEDRIKYNVKLLVETTEEGNYFREKGVPAIVTHVNGIGPARQWAIDNSPHWKVMMLDDDLTNWSHRVDGRYLKGSDSIAIRNALSVVDSLLDSHAHAGIGHRQFANNKPLLDFNSRIMRALAYDRVALTREDIRITLPLMEDFELNLKLLTRGWTSANYYGVVQDQPSSNAPGGCRDMRTLELQEYSARELQRMFPEFVKLKKVDGWDLGPRWDVSVQWKKAFGAYV